MAGAYLLEIRVGGVSVRLLSLRWLLWPVSCLAGLHHRLWQRDTKTVTAVSIDLSEDMRGWIDARKSMLTAQPGEVILYKSKEVARQAIRNVYVEEQVLDAIHGQAEYHKEGGENG